jgi:hypothetical protein
MKLNSVIWYNILMHNEISSKACIKFEKVSNYLHNEVLNHMKVYITNISEYILHFI